MKYIRHIDVGTGVDIPLSEDEIIAFEESRVWLAIQQLLIWRIKETDRAMRNVNVSGEATRFLVGRVDALDNLLMLPEIFRNASRPKSERTEIAEENFKQQLEKMNHE